MAAESKIETNLRERIKKIGGLALKIWCLSMAGFPDRIVLMPGGRIWFVEVKAPGKKPKPHQGIRIEWLRRMGFTVWVIDSNAGVDAFLLSLE